MIARHRRLAGVALLTFASGLATVLGLWWSGFEIGDEEPGAPRVTATALDDRQPVTPRSEGIPGPEPTSPPQQPRVASTSTAARSTQADDATSEDQGPERAEPAQPLRIEVPAIGVDDEVVPVGLEPDGALAVPDFGLAGWYELGPTPGEVGPAVIAAHVDSRAGPDVFYRLRDLEPGDEIRVHDEDGRVHTFTTVGSEQHDKDELPAERIWSDEDEPALRLITCGGAFDRRARSYTDNIIVYARSTG